MQSTSLFKIAESEKEFIIYGPASVEIMDKQGDTIPADLLKNALPQLLRRGRFHEKHKALVLGDILPIYKTKSGEIYRTDVKLPDARDIQLFPYLPIDKEGLFIVGNVYDDSASTQTARKAIDKEELNSFSIGGTMFETADGKIAKVDLDDITICQMGINSYAKFKVIAKTDDLEKGCGPYKDFDACVAANSDKNNPEAYCAAISHEVTGKWPSEKLEKYWTNKEQTKEEIKMADETKPPEKKPEEEDEMKKMLEAITKVGESIAKIDERLTLLEKSAVAKPAEPAEKTEVKPPESVETLVEKALAKVLEGKTTTTATTPRPINKEEHIADLSAGQVQPMTTKELAKMSWKEAENLAESFKKGGKQ